MNDPLKDYNLDFDDYPNWKKGIAMGLAGGFISTICIGLPLLLATAKTSSQKFLSNLLFCAGIFLFCFFIFGAYGAFKPPSR